MAKTIRSIAEAIGIIEKEVGRMVDGVSNDEDKTSEHPQVKPNGYCVECNATTTHKDAYFCGLCAGEFFGGVSKDNENNEEGTE